eukprot:1048181-Rhodomonas_salina.1
MPVQWRLSRSTVTTVRIVTQNEKALTHVTLSRSRDTAVSCTMTEVVLGHSTCIWAQHYYVARCPAVQNSPFPTDTLCRFPSLQGLPLKLIGATVLGCPFGPPSFKFPTIRGEQDC